MSSLPNLEELFPTPIIIDTKKIEIPGFPDAFNAGIFPWEDKILMGFRILPNPKSSYISTIGLIFLNDQFEVISAPQFLLFRDSMDPTPPRAADPRFIQIGQKLYIIYEDNSNPTVTRGGFRIHIGEIILNEKEEFEIVNVQRITEYPGADPLLREKNWVPFEYLGNLYLAYSISPHLIFSYEPNSPRCAHLAMTHSDLDWEWGVLRGGTPALKLESGEYLSFFHSSKVMTTAHSNDRALPHYFIGAYTFEGHPPFQITSMSKDPLITKGFYSGTPHKPYWGSVRCIFPCGFLIKDNLIYLSYGRQDHEIWIARLDKQKLLESLTH